MLEKLLAPMIENLGETLREYPPDFFLRAAIAALLSWMYRLESTRERDWEKLAKAWGLSDAGSARDLYRMVLHTMVKEEH